MANATELRELREILDDLPLAAQLPPVAEAAEIRDHMVAELSGRLLPRLDVPDGPFLLALAGPSGAGRSSLVNSLLRVVVNAAGAVRPTTQEPILVCRPEDVDPLAGASGRLAGLAGTPAAVSVREQPAAPAALCLLDLPDPLVATEQAWMSVRLLAAADIPIFVTTAERYADAAFWRALTREAPPAAAGLVPVLVLDRVPPEATEELRAHLGEMLAAADLVDIEVFVVPEAALVDDLLPEPAVHEVRTWLTRLADQQRRAELTKGYVATAPARLCQEATSLADQLTRIADATHELRARAGEAYDLARRAVESVGRSSRPADGPADEPVDRQVLRVPAELTIRLRAAADDAAARTSAAWQNDPTGVQVLASAPDEAALASSAPDVGAGVETLEEARRALDRELARFTDLLDGLPTTEQIERLRGAAQVLARTG